MRGNYPVDSKFARRGVGLGGEGEEVAAPTSATLATPGSEEKIQELECRAMKGQNLWHSGDPVFTWRAQRYGRGIKLE